MALPLTLEVLVEFARFDVTKRVRGFRAIHAAMRRTRVRNRPPADTGQKVADAMAAVSNACLVYYKRPMCLQRSVALTRVLRRHGVEARLVIGVLPAPPTTHAWVEMGDRVLTEIPEGREFYNVLDVW